MFWISRIPMMGGIARILLICLLSVYLDGCRSQLTSDFSFSIDEGRPPESLVGAIPVTPGSSYRFSVEQSYFTIHSTSGEIRTKVEIDREQLPEDEFDISVLEVREGQGNIPIEINIIVNDINDNAPSFSQSEVQKSLSESAVVGARISLPSVSDQDKGENGTILDPVIVSGNEDSTFALQVINFGSTILRLNLLKRLDREMKDFYPLRILARDNGSPSQSSFLTVNLTVADVNDNPPIFEFPEYRMSLNESTEIGTVVLQVTATDIDAGRNGDIVYYLPQSNPHFSVDPSTGYLTLTNRLVYEDDQYHSFKIEGRDEGSPSQLGRTDVFIDVIDINDHDPEISVSFLIQSDSHASVDEGAETGSVIALVTVTDRDQGDNGAVTLQINSGNELGHFELRSIPSLDGIFSLTVIGIVDREVVPEYNITLHAEDLGVPRRSSMLTVRVVVLDANDHAPVFESSSYSADLAESAPMGSYVSSVAATDMDSGDNAKVSYSITGGNELGWFQIDPSTGLVTTATILDRETASSVTMVITAIDHGRQPLMGTVELAVTIRDVNDVVPLFANQSYQATVPENARAGVVVTTVQATDQDEGNGGIVEYSFADDSLQSLSIFAIDAQSGVITTLVTIDREELAQVSLSVKAKDLGTNPLSSLAMVNVEITDENDNNPIFYPEEYFVSVNENEDIGTYVVTVTATDADIGNNGRVTYFMENSAGGTFEIKNTSSGEIFTTRVLDREIQALYTITVLALDRGGLEAPRPATVFVMVGDIQDNPPTFQQSSYSFQVLENVPSRTYVGSVMAVSDDLAVNITYRISAGDPGGHFRINPETGEIRTRTVIDRESTASLSLIVFAHAGALIGETVVSVLISDVNDNAPSFGMDSASATVVENWSVGRQVYRAQASDPDVPPNSLIAYELGINPGQYFDIDSSSGWISVRSDLRSASQDEFTLEVRATDHGTPQMSSTLALTIFLRDVNSHTPVFQEQFYVASISENTRPTIRFIHVLAEDADQGSNGMVTYNITGGNGEDKFGIFPDGQVYIRSNLDREITPEYLLSITATDEGVPPRSAVTSLSITILDENDHRPVFLNDSYDFYIFEEQRSSMIGMVEATDEDAEANGEVSYAIVTNDTDFTIGIRSGIISSSRVFDREGLESGTFSIVVEAYDGGGSSLSEKISVNIHIDDVNDNTPEFLQSDYRASISELAPKDTNVITVFATDSDLGDNSYVTYGILSGNLDSVFKINHGNGQISVRGSLDRETTSTYTLLVQARDAGSPPLSAMTEVTLTILDENDHHPVIQDDDVRVEITECVEIDDLVTSLVATDGDEGQNSLVSYSIVQGNARGIFRIDPNSGDLYLAKLLDHETDAEYRLNVSAQDSGTTPLKGYASVIVIVRDCNDNAPTFTQTSIVREINEELSVGTEVATVLAEDFDSGINGEVHHSILSQTPDGDFFEIDQLQGTISVRNTIDRETLPEESEGVIQVVIQAIDQALPRDSRQSATAAVTFIIRDVNDNRPEIISQTAAAVQPQSPVNTPVTTVVATDEDSGDNADVTLSLLTPQVPFRIHPATGVVTVSGPIVSSASPYTLRVRAQDRGTSPLASETTLSIIVTETISSGPVFTQNSYSARIEEERPVGSPVTAVAASYANGRSAPIEYYITSTRMGESSSRNYFTITRTSGIISTSAVIDHEALTAGAVFTVTVTAADVGASPPRTRNVEVLVTILDINDNPPTFQDGVYNTSVSEDTSTGTSITRVRAVDVDTRADITYAITEGAEGLFSIDPTDGQITLEGTLDREIRAGYALTVRASDGELSSSTLVAISVLDQNDNSPVFTRPVYSFTVGENEMAPFVVDRVTASDPDEGSNSAISYRIVEEGAPGEAVFSLDELTGRLVLVQELDYEQKQLYYLRVGASDHGQSPLSTTAVVYISVLDVNDNDPVFEPSRYSVEVSESVNVGTQLVTVFATDLDSGLNGEIMYSVHSGDTSGSFAILPNGTLTVARPLDREVQSFYNLEVRAQDGSPENPRSSSAQVSVIVTDINDNAPTFTSPPEVHVLESASPGSLVMTITAEDPDVERNSYIEYSLDPPPEDEAFIIGPVDGSLLVWGRLDREVRPAYNLTVVATDKGVPPKSSSMVVTVVLDDVNDNNPSFEVNSYRETIPENVPVGIEFLQVRAEDPDVGPNAWLTYTIVDGNYNSDFMIDIQSGVISVAKPLDRERRDSYTLTVRAQDSGPGSRFSMCEVVIEVEDVNDNSPTFLDVYRRAVMENNRPQELVVQVSADDADAGANGALTYSLQGNTYSSLFVIDRATGVIRVTRQLDHETTDEYSLTVAAEDGGLPQLMGTTQVIVTIGDTNDNPTTFSSNEYRTTIEEEVELNTVVIQVTANDLDSSAMLRYRLSDEVANKFTIYPLTGHIVTAGRLDREEQTSYELVVMVTDGGETVASTTVFITVTDIDDNLPEFETSSYQVQLPENANAGILVVVARATDADVGPNGENYYSIESGDTSLFGIERTTGAITVSQNLSDQTGDFIIRVGVRDAPDNAAPEDVATIYVSFQYTLLTSYPAINLLGRTRINVAENAPPGEITTVRASSPKDGPVGDVTFHIAGGNEDGLFSLDSSTGVLHTNQILDYESGQEYQLWIEARDGDTPPLSSFSDITIIVLDFNDNAPVFEEDHYYAHVTEGARSGQEVLQVMADDLDSGSYGNIRYVIRTNQDAAFRIGETSGWIYTTKELDRESVPSYRITVEAQDSGSPARLGSCLVTIAVDDINDNPMFTTEDFQGSIEEDSPRGTFVMTIVTQDLDENAVSRYKITGGNPGSVFTVDEDTGEISVNGSLDHEADGDYQLTIQASDEMFSIDIPVSVRILDVNDNPPVFESSVYSVSVPELQPAGTFVMAVSATDRDEGDNGRVRYQMKAIDSIFHLNTVSGHITINRVLEYQPFSFGDDPNIYQLGVLAVDHGSPTLYSEVTVTVEVYDANDHAPIFESATYFSPVPTGTQSSANIVQAKARDDLDEGINAEVSYFIISGNGTSRFQVDERTGWVRVLGNILEGSVGTRYRLVIQAQDGGRPTPLSSTATVDLLLTSANIHAPQFTQSELTVLIGEDQQLGRITTIRANDQDSGINGEVTYNISEGNEMSLFSIGASSGEIVLERELDYESATLHILEITASDRGWRLRKSTSVLTISVDDRDDNPPVFQQREYFASVPENTASGERVAQVIALDVDSPRFAQFTYAIIGGDGQTFFTMGEEDGIIRTQGNLDYEQGQQEYALTVTAANEDGSHADTTHVYIEVTGVNEFSPEFLQREYVFSVSEGAPDGTPLGSVLAVDSDAGLEGRVLYLLIGASNDNGFSIKAETGQIIVDRENGVLDRETKEEVILSVLAKNEGPLSGNNIDETRVVVHILDANDAPVFTPDHYTASVREDAEPQTYITTVTAIEYDQRPAFRQFVYTFLEDAHDDIFDIDATTGRITLSGTLDREASAVHFITVAAVDSGVPPMTGTAQVMVNVGDVNDNGPVLLGANVVGSVTENQAANTHVMTLNATDPDLGSNPGGFRYRLVSISDAFFLNFITGELTTLRRLNREDQAEYQLEVDISDGGSPVVTARSTLRIIVEDQNDQLSSSRNARIEVRMYRTSFPGGAIGTVNPIDGDLGDEFECALTSGDRSQFQIRPGCILYAETQTSESRYTVNVTGNDGIHASVSSSFVVSFQGYNDATIAASVTVRLADLTATQFLAVHYDRFVAAVSAFLASREELIILSLTDDTGDNSVNVLMAVKKRVGYMSRDDLAGLLADNEGSISTRAEVTLAVLDYTACHSNPCLNQGLCHSHHDIDYSPVAIESLPVILVGPTSRHTLTCECGEEYYGDRCGMQIDQCESGPCLNEGRCNDLIGDYSCSCLPGFGGKQCQNDIDECSSDPCRNGGRCADLSNGYRCECPLGYSGANCQDGPCAQDPCMNSGQCTESGSDFTCKCSFSFWGSRCEFSSVSFQSGSYLEYPSLRATENSVVIEFATTLPNVLLALNHDGTTRRDGHFFVLEVTEERVHFSFNLGVGTVTMATEMRVNDGRWHRIQAIRKAQNGELFILDEACSFLPERACRATGVSDSLSRLELSLRGSPLFIGGVDTVDQLTQRPWQTSSVDFVGCMRQISIDGQNQDIDTSTRSVGVTEGCARAEGGMCGTSTCSQGSGVCVDDWWESRCRCDGGQTCLLESTPSSFGGDSFVVYETKETYRRQQLLNLAREGGRRKRAADRQELKLSFRTGDGDGTLLLVKSKQKFTLLEVEGSVVRYSYGIGDYSQGTILMDGSKVDDWRWHNLTLEREDRAVTLHVDDSGKTRNFGGATPHDFTGLEVDTVTLGGTAAKVAIDEQTLQGFAGCIHQFEFDGAAMPLSGGATERFAVTPSGVIGTGCSPVDPCATSPCSQGQSCISQGTGFTCFVPPCLSSPCMNGGSCLPGTAGDSFICGCAEGYEGGTCSMIRAPSTGGEQGLPTDLVIIGLIALIVIIVFVFVVLVVLLLMRKRSKRPEPKPKADNDNMYSNHSSMDNPSFVNQDTFDDATMIGYRSDGKLHDDLHHHLSSVHQRQPDIIDQSVQSSADPSRNSPANMIPHPAYFPEHYDIENASSIAPSDIDVAYHYRHYHDHDGRRGKHRQSPNPMLARIHGSPSRESPLSISRQSPHPFNDRANPSSVFHTPIPHRFQHSPNFMLMQNLDGGMDLRRATSPYSNGRNTPVGSEHSELRSVAHRSDVSSVRSRPKSPSALSVRSRAKSHVSDVSARRRTTDSPVSGISHHSRHSKRSHRSRTPQPDKPLGLTAEEVARLNSARPDLMTGSHTSTIDNLSSVSEEANNARPRKSLLEPPESSSGDESAASFTCSDPDLDTSTYIMTKLASIDDLHSNSRLDSDGAGSHRFSSEEENGGNRGASEPTFSLDQLLNWGPNFAHLSPVCKDLAMLNDLSAVNKRDATPKTQQTKPKNIAEEFV